MAPPIVASVDLNAIMHNARMVRALVRPAGLCAVVKANAYGHGAAAAAHVLAAAGTDMFAVAAIEEAVDLREAGIRAPILLFGALASSDVAEVLQHDVTACVTDEPSARELAGRARARHAQACVHVKVDTGMHRLGFDWETAAEAVLRLAGLEGLRVTGIFTHYACADAADPAVTEGQTRRFRSVLSRLEQAGMALPLAHAANSATVLRMPDARFDAVRPGLILYGMRPAAGMAPEVDLHPALCLRTSVGYCRRVKRGEALGYGHTFTAWRDSLIGVLPAGYADGYGRWFSNLGEVLVRGTRVPVVGRVCMDQTLVDLTDLPGVQPGEEAVLYGRQGDACIRVEDMAARVGTIPYELTCAVGRRVRREYVLNGMVVADAGRAASISADALERLATLAAGTVHEHLPETPA